MPSYVFIIGNAERSQEQLDFIARFIKSHPNVITAALDTAILELQNWPFKPDHYCDLEMNVNHDHRFPEGDTLLTPVYKTILKTAQENPQMLFHLAKWLEQKRHWEKNFRFYHLYHLGVKENLKNAKAGKPPPHGLYRFSDSGNTSCGLMLQLHHPTFLILIGCKGFWSEIEWTKSNKGPINFRMWNQWNQMAKEGWNTLKEYAENAKFQTKILNASLVTTIECFEKIKLKELA